MGALQSFNIYNGRSLSINAITIIFMAFRTFITLMGQDVLLL